MNTLEGKKAAVLIADRFQDEEGIEPVVFLREHGMEVTYLGLRTGTVKGFHERQEVEVTRVVSEADADEYDLLLIPGGQAPEALRLDEAVLEFTRRFFEDGRPVASICHGAQVLISARVLAGRTVTCVPGIRDDVQLAGARYVDKPVVVDRSLITSRIPKDIPAMNEAIQILLAGETVEVDQSSR